jgi:hypothetical protein
MKGERQWGMDKEIGTQWSFICLHAKKVIATCIYKFWIQQDGTQIESTSKQMKQMESN